MCGRSSNSILERLPYADVAVNLFAEAVKHVRNERLDYAADLLGQLDDTALRAHFNEALPEWHRRDQLAATRFVAGSVAKPDRMKLRMPSRAGILAMYRRDGWRCRWCGTCVIYLRAAKRMALTFPDLLPYGRTNAQVHGLILATAASIDHVCPHSHGGTNVDRNLVTACWPCQFGRGNDTIERLQISDPRERTPIIGDDWDGCHTFV